LQHWQTPYVRPQENGAHRGVERVAFALENGLLTVTALQVSVGQRPIEGLTVSARPWSDHTLSTTAHHAELKPDGNLYIHLDADVHGLGSAMLGPRPTPAATLWPLPTTIQLRLNYRAR